MFITDEKRTSLGSGVLFYPGTGEKIYIFICAHVLDELADPFQIYYLLPVNREGIIKHSIDAAVICLEKKKEINLKATDYFIGETHKGDLILVQGFPGEETEIEELVDYVEGMYGKVLHNVADKENILWQIEDLHLDPGNRVYELNGFSGSPVWNMEDNEKSIVGLFTNGVGRTSYRGEGSCKVAVTEI